jgi:hypothetical protein
MDRRIPVSLNPALPSPSARLGLCPRVRALARQARPADIAAIPDGPAHLAASTNAVPGQGRAGERLAGRGLSVAPQ